MRISKEFILIILSIILFFQRELTSFGLFYTAEPITLFPGFYVNDLGLFLPICFIFKYRSASKNNVIKLFLITFVFGFIVYLFNLETSSNIGLEFRLFISFFSGISIILANSYDLRRVVKLFACIFFFFNMIIVLQFLLLPDFDTFLNSRIGSESIYNLIGPQLILLPTLTTLAIFLNEKTITKILIFYFFISLFFSIIFLKTRSLALLFFMGLILSLVTANKIENSLYVIKKKINIQYLLFMILPLILLLRFNSDATKVFIGRIESVVGSSNDENIQSRLLEPVIAFSGFSSLDWLIGAGMSPPSILVAENGETYNSMHIGILNILWRFGVVIFSLWLIVLTKFIYTALNYHKNKKLHIFLISPSIIIWFTVSLFSGGWGLIPIFCLGILLGISISIKNHLRYINK